MKNSYYYIDSPVFDSIFIFGLFFMSMLALAISILYPPLFFPILGLTVWFLGYHHVIAAFTKLAGTKEDRRKNRVLILYLPPLVVLAVFLLAYFVGLWIIASIYFFWQWYHYTRQSYGISLFYVRKMPEENRSNPHLETAALWAMPVIGLVWRCVQDAPQYLGMDIWFPAISYDVLVVTAGFGAAILALWLMNQIRAWFEGRLSYGYFFYMMTHHLIFFIGYYYIYNINMGWMVAMIWHNSQYILFVWLHNHHRTKVETDKSWLGWLSERNPIRLCLYFTVCVVLTYAFYKSWHSLPLLLEIHEEDFYKLAMFYMVIGQSINFHHYLIDAVMWKRKRA